MFRGLAQQQYWRGLVIGCVAPLPAYSSSSRYCNASSGTSSVAPFGPTIQVGNYKLLGGNPGQSDIIAWPEPAANPVPFGRSGGVIEPGTDHWRAGSLPHTADEYVLYVRVVCVCACVRACVCACVRACIKHRQTASPKQQLAQPMLACVRACVRVVLLGACEHPTNLAHPTWYTGRYRAGDVQCSPWCLFDVVADPSESHDLASDPQYAAIVQQLVNRVTELGAAGPPWAWPLSNDQVDEVLEEICNVSNTTRVYEPVRETAPPRPAPPPAPVTTRLARNGLCLGAQRNATGGVNNRAAVAMVDCNDPAANWTTSFLRSHVALRLTNFFPHGDGDESTLLCLAIQVNPTTMKCVLGIDHTPHIRACSPGDPTTGAGGNPVGCAFQFNASMNGKIESNNCVDEPHTCLGVVNGTALAVMDCAADGAKGWSQVVS